MTDQQQADEFEIRRRSQELAVAWRKGRAAFVLDSLAAEEPLRAALIGALVHETLARWDPYDSRLPNGFRFALLVRSQGAITSDELAELEREYCRTFGSSPPLPPLDGAADGMLIAEMMKRAERIRVALASGRPLIHGRHSRHSSMFLRRRPTNHRPGMPMTASQDA